MKFCTKCGNKLSDSMKFCNKCGAKVKPVDKDTENNSNPEDAKNISNIENDIDKTIILDAPKIKKETCPQLTVSKQVPRRLFQWRYIIILKFASPVNPHLLSNRN